MRIELGLLSFKGLAEFAFSLQKAKSHFKEESNKMKVKILVKEEIYKWLFSKTRPQTWSWL
jgi:hypothetical protein